jgi:pimeloyl-ACP methyl ester carboxylesterase
LATARDTAALAASLELGPYAVFGTSGGGPHALATAVADPAGVRAPGWSVAPGRGDFSTPPDTNPEGRGFLAMLEAGNPAGAWSGMHTSAEAELSVLRALDEICTPAAGRWYQDRIDGAHLEILPGEGHLDVCDRHWPEVLAGLLSASAG